MFRGSYVALITPFDRKGRVDAKALKRLVHWHIQEGTEGIVCCGSTGEGIALSDQEKLRVASLCIEAAEGRLPIVVGTGTAATGQTVQLTEKAKKLGAKGCLVVTPYYNKPTQQGCICHFKEVAQVGLPVIVYHNPGRAVVRLLPETVAELAEIPHIAALKDSGHDITWVQKVRRLCSLPLLAGDDDFTYEILKEGGVGAISVIGNLIPHAWKQMIEYCLRGKWEEAKRRSERLMPFCKALFLEANPQCVKKAMKIGGKSNGILRLPLLEPGEEVATQLKKALIALSFPYAAVPLAV